MQWVCLSIRGIRLQLPPRGVCAFLAWWTGACSALGTRRHNKSRIKRGISSARLWSKDTGICYIAHCTSISIPLLIGRVIGSIRVCEGRSEIYIRRIGVEYSIVG